jgi:hypothetical protein
MATTSSRLVQLGNGMERRVALVEEPRLRLLRGLHSVRALATEAIRRGDSLSALAGALHTEAVVDYDPVYHGSPERNPTGYP